MKKVMSEKLENHIKQIFRDDETWKSELFWISDNKLHTALFPVPPRKIYSKIRDMSLRAEDKIHYRVTHKGEFFDDAKRNVKFEFTLPLLLKVRSFGWREANQGTLNADQKKRFKQGLQHFDFARNRSEKIESMLTVVETIEEEN